MDKESMDLDVGQLVKKRGRVRAVISRCIGMIESAVKNEDIERLEFILKSLNDKSKHLEELNEKVQEVIDEDLLENDIDESFEFSMKISKSTKDIETRLQERQSSAAVPIACTSKVSVKLPKLQLPKFSGKCLEFQSFWDMFETAILSNNDLSNIQKFAYLNSCLVGEAQACLSGLTLTDDNFKLAVELLAERFGQKDVIVREHLNKLQTCRPPAANPNSLKQFMYDIVMHKRCLENLRKTPDMYEAMLMPILLKKVPEEVRLRLLSMRHQLHEDVYTLDGFITILNHEVKIREECKENDSQVTSSKTENSHVHVDASRRVNQASGSAVTLPTVAVDKQKKAIKTQKFCVYCDKNDHFSSECTTVCSIDERIESLKRQKRCFSCIQRFHNSRNCPRRKKCPNCSRNHHISLCNQLRQEVDESPNRNSRVQDSDKPAVSLFLHGSKSILLPSAKVIVRSAGGNEMRVRLLLDQCSTKTFIRTDVCQELGIIPEVEERITINAFGSENVVPKHTGRVKFSIRKLDSSQEEIHLEGNSVESICFPQPSYELSSLSQFQGLDMADEYDPRDRNMPVSILVGADFYYDIVTDTTVRGEEGPVALSSRIGWLASGSLTCPRDDFDQGLNVVCLSIHGDDALNDELKSFWTSGGQETMADFEDDTFLSHMVYDEQKKRYSIKLPWKCDKTNIDLDTNFEHCLKKLGTTLKQLRAKKSILEEYRRIIEDQLDQDILEPVPDSPSGCIVHYLPHHPVVRPHAESTKVRVVLDASAKYKSKKSLSLNECLNKGTCRLPRIPILLSKFRLHAIAVLADVEKAFLQIEVDEDDRDALRILWVEHPDDRNSHLQVYRYKALVFGLKSSPAVLEHVLQYHLSTYSEGNPDLISKIKDEIYVDNLISGVDTYSEAEELYRECRRIFQEGHFNLRQWETNDAEFTKFIQKDVSSDANVSKEKTTPDDYPSLSSELNPAVANHKNMSKVLGVLWDNKLDEFVIDLAFLEENLEVEAIMKKRDILKVTARVYDPLGFLCPILLDPKRIFREICTGKLDWNDSVDPQVDLEFRRWAKAASKVKLNIPRCLFDGGLVINDVSIHGFSDASFLCYAACVYIRVSYACGKVDCFLLMAKSRLAPMTNPQTIPRLELMGALLLARTMSTVVPLFPSSNCFYWCDSKNSLYWIKQEYKIWKCFIENRVREIRRLSNSESWRFVPGDENPCDVATRPLSPTSLKQTCWLKGPRWLYQDPTEWPEDDLTSSLSSHSTAENEKSDVCMQVNDVSENSLLKVIDIERYSSYKCLLRVTAYVNRVVSFRKTSNPDSLELTSEEIARAEMDLIRAFQAEEFPAELSHLRHGTHSTNLSRSLALFLEDGIIRCRGRLSSCVSNEMNCPILLPRSSHFITLLVRSIHEELMHGGVSSTLAGLRQKFWLLQGRQTIKRILNKCVWCKRIRGLPYKATPVPDLPDYRVEGLQAFNTVGLDYCGPLRYRKGEGDIAKCYICLFTCASSRAVHLELVANLSTEAFLRAFRKFTARRGIPAVISDNFSSFKKAFKDLDAVSKSSLVRREAADRRIQWDFIVEYSPWEGGFYERLVKEVKDSLKKVLKFAILDWDELQTVLVEIESVLNSRPLCYVSDEVNEHILTPSHFLILKRHTGTPIPCKPVQPNLIDKYKGSRRILEKFWKIWTEEYLASLRERTIKYPRSSSVQPKPGDVVVIKDEKPRLLWKLGRIISCKPGRDGAVRSATVGVVGGRGSREYVRRPTRLLIPLEVSSVCTNTCPTD